MNNRVAWVIKILIICPLLSFGQVTQTENQSISGSITYNNFTWDKTDSVGKSKSQIYSDTKMFIAETWKSAQAVLQNDDKESGIVLIKGTILIEERFMSWTYKYYYGYNVTFKMKDNKYKIIIDNVYCDNAYVTDTRNSPVLKVDPFEGDNCPKLGLATSLPRNALINMMPKLKKKIDNIVIEYADYMQKPSASDDW